jgi:hypothetical protein
MKKTIGLLLLLLSVTTQADDCYNEMTGCLNGEVECLKEFDGSTRASSWNTICMIRAKKCAARTDTCDDNTKLNWMMYFACSDILDSAVCRAKYLE